MRRLLHSQAFGFSTTNSTGKSAYKNYSSMCYSPFLRSSPPLQASELGPKVNDIFNWAKECGAQYYSFLAFPHSNSLAEKQQSFLSIQYQKQLLLRNIATHGLRTGDILKGEADGSSFPNGGLRATHEARGYFIWDWKSDVFVKRSNNVLYIPALLVNHHGEALDDKTTFRKSQDLIQKECTLLLDAIGIKSKGIFVGLGLEQQFFIVPKDQYMKRLDLTQTSRTLFSLLPPNSQQLSQHYYSKLEPQIESVLSEAEETLLQIGVPIKTRHKEVAPNQYQFCSVFEDAGKAIQHNLIKMWVLQEISGKHGLKAIYHEKPFYGVNGSGKHMNWSINYWAEDGKLKGLFKQGAVRDDVYLLFVLIKLKAILNNQQLYMSTIAVPGNQLRLGGHEAPPRIFSTFLGQTLTHLLNSLSSSSNTPSLTIQNLKQRISHLICNLQQEDTDRNRTSPYAYTSNRYEFRAVGSSQNCYFPMTVILTTIAKEMREVREKLGQGEGLPSIIEKLCQQTARIRFEGDGYSKSWHNEAKQRNLYISGTFTQNLSNIHTHGKVLIQEGVYTQRELSSKSRICQEQYVKVVEIQARTMLLLINQNIVPRVNRLLESMPKGTVVSSLVERYKRVEGLLGKIIEQSNVLERVGNGTYTDISSSSSSSSSNDSHGSSMSPLQAETLRSRLFRITETIEQVLMFLEEDPQLPELYRIMGSL